MKNRSIGVALSYTNTILSMICGLFLSSFLLKQVGDTDYGIYQTMASFANYLVLLEFGTGTVLARNLSAARARGETKQYIEKNISTVWTITAALSVVILAVSVAFYFAIPAVYANTLDGEQIALGKNIFIFIVIFLLSSFVSQTLNGVALAHEQYTFSSITSIVKLISRTIVLAALVGHFKAVVIISAVDAAIGVAIAVFSYFYCRKAFQVKINFRSFDKLILQSSLPLCLAIFLQAIVNQSNSIVGKFVLGVMAGPEDVTLYSVALYVFSIFSSLTTIPVSLYRPQVTQHVVSGLDGLPLTKTLVQPCRLTVLVSGAVLFGFFACGKQFITIVYGQEYILAWAMALMLIAPSFINESNAIVLNVLDVKNKRLMRSYFLMITTALNILMTIVGIKLFGIVAAAAATGISTLLQAVMMNIYYQKAVNIKIPYLFFHVFKGVLPYQIIGAGLGFVVGRLIENIYVSFLAAGATYVVVAFGCFLLFGKNEEEKHIIEKCVKRIIKKKG